MGQPLEDKKMIDNNPKHGQNKISKLLTHIARLSNRFNRKHKKVVYTAITGNYDELYTPEYVNNDWDYICFTDNPDLTSNFWQIRKMEKSDDLDLIKKARKYKIQPHHYLPEYDISLWVDGNFRIIGNIDDYINRYVLKSSMMCINHPDKNCVYQEAKAVVELEKDIEYIVSTQTNKYMGENYPPNNGMIASGILYRKHNDPVVKELMDGWWDKVKAMSRRDQLSFNYVCWKKDFKYDICDLSYWGNEYFERTAHKNQ